MTRYTGEQLRDLFAAVEGIALKITGDWAGQRFGQPLETRWASVGHALSEMVSTTLDGYGGGASLGAKLGELARYEVSPQWTKRPGIPGAMRHAEDIAEVSKAWSHAYDVLPETGGLLDRDACELACIARYVGGLSTYGVGELLSRRLYWWEPPPVDPDERYPEEPKPKPITPKMAGRVTRHGAEHVYQVLLAKGMVPVRRTKKRE